MEIEIEFVSDRFLLTGPIREDANAGNQFYGEDCAGWIVEALPEWKLDFLDEDWGWLVFTTREHRPEDEQISICVYADPEEGAWRLVVFAEYRRPWMGLLKKWQRGPVPESFSRALTARLGEVSSRVALRRE